MRKIFHYICSIIIIFVGIFDIYYRIHYEIKQYKFLKEAVQTTANIYQTTNRDDGKQVLYINFYVKNKKYEGVLVLKEKTTSQSTITIYYDKNNPVEFTNGEIDKSGLFVMIIGFLFVLVGIIIFMKDLFKYKRIK